MPNIKAPEMQTSESSHYTFIKSSLVVNEQRGYSVTETLTNYGPSMAH